MIRSLISCCFTFIFASGVVMAEATYRFSVAEDDPSHVEISATFAAPHGRLVMVQSNVPEGVPLGFADLVDDLVAVDSAGESIGVEGDSKNPVWKLARTSEQAITIRYRLRLEHGSYLWPVGTNEAAYKTDEMLFFTGQAAFVHVQGLEDILVEFDIPDGWILSTPWGAVDGSPNTFFVDDIQALTRNCFTMGTYDERNIRDGETDITLVAGKEIVPVVAKYENDLKTLLHAYRELFGRSANSRFLMVINHAAYDGAGAFPSSISIETTETNAGIGEGAEPKLLYLLAHETLHLWNGRMLKPAGQIEWFKEGVTDYYSWMSMYRAGQISQETLFGVLGNRIGRYQSAAGSVSIASSGREKSDNYAIVYYGGLTAGLMLDLDIRMNSKGKRSLDDVMRGLTDSVVGKGRGYRLKGIAAQAESASGESHEAFFEEHLKGTDALPVAATLERAGLAFQGDGEGQRLVIIEKISKKQRTVVDGWLAVTDNE